MSPILENILLTLCDITFSVIPQKTPSIEQLKACRLVSHRGERDNQKVFENTFAAFDPVVEKRIWGIEFDVRWSKDLVPMVIHDESALRVFGKNIVISECTCLEIQKSIPDIPTLESLIDRYGKRCHLMIELKSEIYPKLEQQKQTLQSLLAPLTPSQDFHIIALDTPLFSHVDFLPTAALLPVSTTNASKLSELSLQNGLDGITGHYLFMSQALIKKHHLAGQKVGSGFANSQKILLREINKNVDWIFSNQALKMHQTIQSLLR